MKTKFFLPTLALHLFIFSFGFAQTEMARNSEPIVLSSKTTTEVFISMMEPSFAGGNEALTVYMKNNLQYPEMAKKNGIEGTVLLEYYITDNGTVENVKVIKSAHDSLNAEAIRLVENMPLWNPAIQNGNPTRVKYQLPVTFDLRF